MGHIHITYSDIIDAPPETIYAVISDYRVGHPAILPKPYFTEMTVEEGGKGAGTIVRLGMNVLGIKLAYRQIVSEPEPGRVLVEADPDAGMTTTFALEPLKDGKQTRVTITTDVTASPGFKGLMEKLVNPPITQYIYKKELKQLADYVREKRAAENDD